MKNTKKILLVNNGLGNGGIQKASVSLANYFSAIGYEVSLVALYKSIHFYEINHKIHFIEPNFDRISLNKYIYLFKMMCFLRKQIKQIQPNVILAFGEWTNPFVIMTNIGTKIPLFLSDRMSPLLNLGKIQEFFKRKMYPLANGIIAQTQYAKTILEKKIKVKNIAAIPNPVNSIDKINCTPQKYIITVGRLSKEKGHKYLIEAFSRIKNQEWELHLVGDGPERAYLEDLVKKNKIADRVVFYGYKKSFVKQLSASQIFVLPSLSEGFPNALIEAMSLPLACISTNITGPNEIIENEVNGLLVEPKNVEDLIIAIDCLIEDEILRKKIANEALKVRDKLAFDNIALQYLNFILK